MKKKKKKTDFLDNFFYIFHERDMKIFLKWFI